MKTSRSSFESEPMEDAAERFGGSYLVLLSRLLLGVGNGAERVLHAMGLA